MLKLLTVLFAMVPSVVAKDKPVKNICSNNPIYCQIVKNHPKLKKDYAMTLSNAIYWAAKVHNVDPKKYAAILAQESMYNLKATNCSEGVCKDYGIAQINVNTAKAFKLDVNRLTTDLHYSLAAGAMVLADFKRMYGHKDKEYWTRYNSSDKAKREKYKTLVARYL